MFVTTKYLAWMAGQRLGACRLLLALLLLCACITDAWSQTAPPNLNDVPSDLVVPQLSDGPPAPGKRVQQFLPGYEGSQIYHVLYLPPEWQTGKAYPVIVEYPGNGGFKNNYGDISTGRVEDCKLGYGLSGGHGFIWICLPFVDPLHRQHALKWWGDADATAQYCREAVAHICSQWGGDVDRLVLTGFSRGAIACNYIGLRDEATAKLWRAMIVHSHYDGVRKWGYADDDPTAARQRAARFGSRPQFITHELSVAAVTDFLKDSSIRTTIVALPYPNHSDQWVLKDIPLRAQARQWLSDVLSP
jgi:hypothetical protein